MEVQSIRVEHIEFVERQRALDASACDRLAASMREIGLRQPITIRIVESMEIDGQVIDGVPVLVAGRHRLEAAKLLGWSHIDCIEVDDDQLRAELWEIDENLMRAELSPAQQADHLARRKEVWRALLLADANCATKPQHRDGFAKETAQATGVHKSTINRDVARADALGPDLKLIAGTSLDKGVEMDALAHMEPEQRAPIIARAVAGERVTARAVLADHQVILNQVNAILAVWNRASPEARTIAMEQMDTPAFDRTRAGASG